MKEFIVQAYAPNTIKSFKEHNAQEIVRCKDCKFKGISYSCILDRDLEEYGSHRTEENDNWFCADGERKDE